MTTPHCIITGADILFGTLWQHGDLWEMGDVYIFNAVGEPRSQDDGDDLGDKTLAIHGGNHRNYFERRNIFVVPKSEATLSAAALTYIGRSPV